jgi:hypothetical protein
MKAPVQQYVTAAALLLLAGVAFVGCAGSPVVDARKAGITSVTVERRVGIARPLQYGAKSSGQYAGLADLILTGIYKGKSKTVAELLEETEIDVPQLAREQFIAELEALGELTVVTNGGQGTFILTLEQHGFDTFLFSSRPIPFLELRGELLDVTGRRLWRATSGLVGMGAGPIGGTWEEYRADPERLRHAWHVQTTRAAQALLRSKRTTSTETRVNDTAKQAR